MSKADSIVLPDYPEVGWYRRTPHRRYQPPQRAPRSVDSNCMTCAVAIFRSDASRDV